MDEIKIVETARLHFDFEGAKAELENKVAPYRNMVFTEDSKKEAKETVAQLRKDQKDLADKIKEIKKEYMKPFEEFSSQAMELCGLYEEPITFINDQIKAFEEARKAEKKELINSIYEDVMGEDEIRDFLPLTYIFNPKWENATATKKQITEEMMNLKITAKNGIATIKGFNSDKEAEAIALFKRELNITDAIAFIQKYEADKAEILRKQEEDLRKAEEERIRAEERAKIEAEQKQEQAIAEAKAETIEAFIPEAEESEQKAITYIIQLTDDAKRKLEMFMDSVGIEYEELIF